MILIKVMKRKDAASTLVAITLGFIISFALQVPIYDLSTRISYVGDHSSQVPVPQIFSWRGEILSPIASIVFGILMLEVLAWIYVLGVKFLPKVAKKVVRK